jgi:small subunit ribosomal protein S20
LFFERSACSPGTAWTLSPALPFGAAEADRTQSKQTSRIQQAGRPEADVANIKSQIKRVKTNEKRRQRNKSVKSTVKTAIRNFREAADQGSENTAELQRKAAKALDKAAGKGVIHKNQAANRKSAMAKRLNKVGA